MYIKLKIVSPYLCFVFLSWDLFFTYNHFQNMTCCIDDNIPQKLYCAGKRPVVMLINKFDL